MTPLPRRHTDPEGTGEATRIHDAYRESRVMNVKYYADDADDNDDEGDEYNEDDDHDTEIL